MGLPTSRTLSIVLLPKRCILNSTPRNKPRAPVILTVMCYRQSNHFKADSHIACRAHAVRLQCRAAKGLECVFPIRFTQCDRVRFTLAMSYPCHASTMPFFSRPQHSTAVSRRPCLDLEKNGMIGAWHGHGMASVNHTRSHCVNQMGKTHSKPLAARHGMGTVWAWHGHSMLCVNRPLRH